MSGKPNYKGQAPPKYLADFSKALASEVRILLKEVGELRDERRQLQYEISELMAVKSKHGAGGEYTPDWRPREPPPEPPPPVEESLPPAPAKPAWRTVTVRPERNKDRSKTKAALVPAQAPPPPPLQPQLPAWASWKPNHLISPVPRVAAAVPMTPVARAPAGLFGPRTPPP